MITIFKKSIVLIILFGTLAYCTSLKTNVALAHPADEIGIKVYDQKQILEISPTGAKLTIDLTFYAIDKAKLWSSINTNGDQTLSEKEKAVWMKKGQEASYLEVNSK